MSTAEPILIQRPLEDVLPESFLGYSKFVILHRAIPDVRDGLKPVHRRIIYSMSELGMSPDKAYSKSARLVGHCMGAYHPHGDTAIYDSAVRMAQPWASRYPFVDGHGNFGSIDGDGAAAMRYCVTGDALVNTNRGLIPIAELVSSTKINSDNALDIFVESVYREQNHASKLFNSGVHDILEVKTQFGYKIKGTVNHPILILNKDSNGVPYLTWSLLKNIKIGDFVVINRDRKQIEAIEDLITETEALMLGAMVSEGFYSAKNYRLGFSNTNLEFVADVENAFKKNNPNLNIFHYNKPGKRHNCMEINIHSKQYLNEFLRKYNFAKGSAHQVVPNCVLRSSKKIQKIFLRYLFEGDGCPVRYKLGNFAVSYSSSSIRLLEQVQTMLLQFGVVSSITGDRDRYRLIISGIRNLKLFKDEINFAYKNKRENLERFFEECDKTKDHTMTDRIPFVSEYFRAKYKSKWLQRTNFDRVGNLYVFAGRLKEILGNNDYILLSEVFNPGYIYLPVESITPKSSEVVYSISVDSYCHSFTANGFINHNTEIRMTPLSLLMCQDLNKDTVQSRPNYDNRLQEPSVLPSPIPNILLNGTSGIAVGMASNMPPHNLGETVASVIAQIDRPSISLVELMDIIPGPDFPTGAFIVGNEGIREAYETGRGKVIMRAKANIVSGKGGKTLIIITEIPYQVNKAALAAKIEALAESKIDGINDVRDESDREGMRLVVEVKKDEDPARILEILYKNTPLQETFGVINLVVSADGTPQVMGLKAILSAYIMHRKDVITRRTKYDLKVAKARAHLLEALVIAIQHLDEVIALIRAAQNPSQAKAALIMQFDFDEIQVQAILDMKLQHLTGLELDAIHKEYDTILKRIAELETILADEKQVYTVMKKELRQIADKYGDERRTQIINEEQAHTVYQQKELIYVSRQGQVAKASLILQDGDAVVASFDSAETICLVTAHGKCVRFASDSVPTIQSDKTKGVKGITLDKQDKVVSAFSVASDGGFIVTLTEQGYVKRTPISEYPIQGRGGKGVAVAQVDDKTGWIKATVYGDERQKLGKIKFSDIKVEARAKRGNITKL